ncbi:unnamed protein product, partial [Amoebophrya sp. A120]
TSTRRRGVVTARNEDPDEPTEDTLAAFEGTFSDAECRSPLASQIQNGSAKCHFAIFGPDYPKASMKLQRDDHGSRRRQSFCATNTNRFFEPIGMSPCSSSKADIIEDPRRRLLVEDVVLKEPKARMKAELMRGLEKN